MRWGLDFCCWQLREGELGKFGLVASVSLSRFLPRFFFFRGSTLELDQSDLTNPS